MEKWFLDHIYYYLCNHIITKFHNLLKVNKFLIQQMVDKDMDYDDSETSGGWISWFCNLEGHEFFCEIDEEYIKDSFNLYGLKQLVPKYEYRKFNLVKHLK